MKSEVKAKLENIFKYSFFNAVGGPLPDSVTKVTNWQAAIKSCGSQKWDVCQTMARNALQHAVEQSNIMRTQEWSPLFEEIRPRIDSFLDIIIPKSGASEKSFTKLKNYLRWDIMFICLEINYEDIVKPIFYVPVVEPWYAKGHFPCGGDGDEFSDNWDGVIRGGQLIVC